jgi:transposase-like protein
MRPPRPRPAAPASCGRSAAPGRFASSVAVSIPLADTVRQRDVSLNHGAGEARDAGVAAQGADWQPTDDVRPEDQIRLGVVHGTLGHHAPRAADLAMRRVFLRGLEQQLDGADETYVRVKGRWMYLYRAVDSHGQTIDFLLSAKRHADAAKRFFRKALGQPHMANPRTITVDKNPAYSCATTEMKENSELRRFARLRQAKFLNNIIEQGHRRVKRLARPGQGFGSFHTARRTLAGYEAMAMIRKGQVRDVRGRDMPAQASFIASYSRSPPDFAPCRGRSQPPAIFATQPPRGRSRSPRPRSSDTHC